MAGRGGSSFQKRQKEQLRLEKRQEKTVRKQQRKNEKGEGGLDAVPIEPLEIDPSLDRMPGL